MKQRDRAGRPDRAVGRLDPDHRRKRRRQGSRSRATSTRNPSRADKPFISVNCAAIPENLLESELFGHEKGAFTGAVARRIGKFEEADGGTLLLDEISEMDVRLQAKLLRAMQEREIDRVGGGKPVQVDYPHPRHVEPRSCRRGARGEFREDLLYRLNVVNLRIPPLRERPDDVVALATLLRREIRRRQRPARAPAFRGGARAQSWRTPGPAMCASSRTPCTARCCWRTARRSTPTPSACPTARRCRCTRATPRPRAIEAGASRGARAASADGRGGGAGSDPRDARPLPRQPHACGEHPRHLDPHAAQQAEAYQDDGVAVPPPPTGKRPDR